MRRWLVLVALVVTFSGWPSPAWACKFCCGHKTPTLRQDAAEAKLILVGTIGKSRSGQDGRGNPTPEGVEGTTDFKIEQALRTNEIIGNAKIIELPRVVRVNPGQERFLIFLDVAKGNLDPYKGIPASSATVDYLAGILQLDPKNTRDILAYAFRYLEHPDKEIATDAFREFDQVEYKDYRDLAPTLLPDLLARWLVDPDVPVWRKGLYAQLLGHCGRDQDALLLRKLMDETAVKESSSLSRFLVGYTLLRPEDGWACMHRLMKDRSREFLQRYNALQAVRFFWEMRPEVVARHDLKEGINQLLTQEDMADLVIEDLRRWGQWDAAARILALQKVEAIWKVPIMRRSIVRYALCCPHPAAARFVGELRKNEAEFVQEVEELLQLEKGESPKSIPTES